MFDLQNLLLDKPKKKSGKIWGHSRTLSRVEALGMVRLLSLHVLLLDIRISWIALEAIVIRIALPLELFYVFLRGLETIMEFIPYSCAV